jgi:predicted short-subunit dehydrogenase-like oxidoreductase (DUF2520 family)
LLSAALENTLTYGDAALTGPIMRGDVETVRAHLASIALNKPSTLASYVAMARATAEHVVADGRLEPRRADEILALLDAAVLDPRPGRPA